MRHAIRTGSLAAMTLLLVACALATPVDPPADPAPAAVPGGDWGLKQEAAPDPNYVPDPYATPGPEGEGRRRRPLPLPTSTPLPTPLPEREGDVGGAGSDAHVEDRGRARRLWYDHRLRRGAPIEVEGRADQPTPVESPRVWTEFERPGPGPAPYIRLRDAGEAGSPVRRQYRW